MKKEMLINVLQPEECRIAIIENGVLEELYVERTSHESYTGNIYKGKVVNLEPAIQAAFVDFSVGRNGFLHVSDVEPQYYDRHQPHAPGDDDHEPAPGPRPREPRRDDRRRPPADSGPRAEDRGPRPERPERPERPQRERPDRSVRGHRDRSEMPRQFGEGLDEERRFPSKPKNLPEPTARQPESQERDKPAMPGRGREAAAPTSWSEPVEFDWGVDRPREREFGAIEPQDVRGGKPRPGAEPFDPDLPPSRTQRARSAPLPDPDFQLDERGRPRSLFGAQEPLVERERERDEPSAEIESESTAAGRREPRRGRGRGRSSTPPAAQRPAPPAEDELAEPSDFETGLAPSGREFPDLDQDDSQRRRGGRAAIRSRGGDRPEPERPREIQPIARETAPIAPEPSRPGRAPSAPSGPAAPPSRYAGFDRLSESDSDIEPERDRPQPHNRAGEPGYVPRRERQRAPDLEFGERPFEPIADLDPRADLLADDDVAEAGVDEPTAKTDGRRRRRRRGRRNGRERSEVESPTTANEPEAFETDFDEPTSFREPAPAYARGAAEDDFGDDLIDELDINEDSIDDLDDLIHDDLGGGVATRAVDEEIDPELEQEIRKEIEEIEELEREMGLRGPVEARPRRGDEGKFGRGRGMVKPPLQDIFRRGDEVLVQVIKESIGTKGPTLSTYISIPGRYLVLMPGLNRVGVSRKIVDEGQRRKLREIMHELNPPKGLGFIVRTAGLERTKRELARDLAYLLRLWKVILRRIKKAKSPAPIYQESDMITRTIRDIFTSEIDTIWIDEPAAFERAQEFLRVVMPRFVNRVKLYDEKVPLFHKYGIEDEIAKIQRRHVPLPEGGSIVIDQTEALVAIDVNSGNFRVEDDAERTAYEMNLRAAKEIARQLRLRDLGGVIVNDFIDMRDERHRRGVERALREAIKRDRARTKVLRMSAFGLIEMTRQRIRPSLKRSIYEDCQHCTGSGVVKTAESMAIDVMRILALAGHREDIRRINVTVGSSVATYLNNRKRQEITRIENESGISVLINFKHDVPAEHLQLECFDANGGEVRLFPAPAPGHHRRPH